MPKVNTNMPKKARLDEICEIIAGQSPSSETYNDVGEGLPFYQGKADFGELHPRARKWCNAPVKIAQKDDVLVSVRAPVGPSNIANDTCCIGRGLAAVRAKLAIVLPKYVYWAIKHSEPALAAMSTGTTFAAITRKDLASLEVSLPPLDEQQRIVDILDRAASIQRLRQAADEKLKQIIPALFVDMFGDPATNPKGWLTTRLGTHVEEFRYGTSQKSGATGLPVLRIPNVISDTLDTGEIKLVELNAAEQQRLLLRDGDLLFVRTNGNPDYVGRSAVFDRTAMDKAGFDGSKCVYASYLIRARLNAGLSPHFLQAYLTTAEGRKFLRERSKTSAGQYNINIDGLSSLPVYVPPISLQNLFCEKIAAIRATVGLAEKANTTGKLIAASLSAQLCNP